MILLDMTTFWEGPRRVLLRVDLQGPRKMLLRVQCSLVIDTAIRVQAQLSYFFERLLTSRSVCLNTLIPLRQNIGSPKLPDWKLGYRVHGGKLSLKFAESNVQSVYFLAWNGPPSFPPAVTPLGRNAQVVLSSVSCQTMLADELVRPRAWSNLVSLQGAISCLYRARRR